MNCLNCTHWNLKDSSLRAHGFGLCKTLAQPGRTFAAGNPCRFGKFVQAPADMVAKREKVIA